MNILDIMSETDENVKVLFKKMKIVENKLEDKDNG